MDKNVTEFLKWLSDKSEYADNYIWSIDDALQGSEFTTLKKIFTEEQAVVIRAIVKQTVHMVDWHNKNDDESHNDIRKKIDKLQAQFRNHRHDSSKNLGGKAEY